jgi:ketosteroid isomerase-like protein
MSDIKKPTVHMNGSGKKRLVEQYSNAMHALNNAIQALNEAYPHGRDYYVQGDGVIDAACREQDARIKAVRTVRNDIMDILRHLNGSIDF